MEGCTRRRKPRRDIVHRGVWRVQDRSKDKDRNRGKASAKKQGEGGGTLRDLREVKRKYRNDNGFARPNGLHDAETAISCKGPGPAECIPVVGRMGKKMHGWALVARKSKAEHA